jgi:hypothetical protein
MIENWILNLAAFTYIGLVYYLVQTIRYSNKKDKTIEHLINIIQNLNKEKDV